MVVVPQVLRGSTMTFQFRAVLWIDHAQARLIRVDGEALTTSVIHPSGGTPHLHHKAHAIDSGHLPENQSYLHAVARAIAGAESVLVTGPANAKLEFMKHLERHDPQLVAKVSEVRTVDHPSDGELLDLARRHFAQVDRGLARHE
jgi:hypothetical protein